MVQLVNRHGGSTMLGLTVASKVKKTNARKKVFDLSNLPQPTDTSVAMRGPLLGTYLKRLLQGQGVTESGQALEGWVLPSTMELSGFFHCSECDVLEAFHELQRSGYNYEVFGLDCPIVMHSPVYSRQADQPWKMPSNFITNARA
jgi:hypothetical protein